MRSVVYSKQALKALRAMPTNTAKLIVSKVTQYAAEPTAQANNVTALKGQPGHHRLRVGDWRVIFSDDGEVIAIIKIAPRGAAYD